jgi:hypothetical protein
MLSVKKTPTIERKIKLSRRPNVVQRKKLGIEYANRIHNLAGLPKILILSVDLSNRYREIMVYIKDKKRTAKKSEKPIVSKIFAGKYITRIAFTLPSGHPRYPYKVKSLL